MTERQFYDWQTAGGGGDVLRLINVLERLVERVESLNAKTRR